MESHIKGACAPEIASVKDSTDVELTGCPHAMTTIEEGGLGREDRSHRTHALAVNIGLLKVGSCGGAEPTAVAR